MALVDFIIKLMNFSLFWFFPRKASNFRWANSTRDAINFVGHFAKGQFTKIYGRISAKYNYHPLQRYENAIRQFNINETLRTSMGNFGNVAFYQSVCGLANPDKHSNSLCDFTEIDELNTVGASSLYLYNQVYQRRVSQATRNNAENDPQHSAEMARTNFMRGFSRVVHAADHADWEKFRNELRDREHKANAINDTPEDRITLIALSYKGKDLQITRRMQNLGEDGTPVLSTRVIAQTTAEMTTDFLDDFRWSQLVRSCIGIARREKTEKVRVWIDRLVMMDLGSEEIAMRYKLSDWEEFGLFPYAICPVVRLYDRNEKYFGTDFWRKLETVLGVAGKGLFVDDYMLRKFDETIFYGREMYHRYENGISRIGGTGVYVRATTLALATAILTDGVTTSAVNEDVRTKDAVGGWKAWALRTIGEGAYSTSHFFMMAKEDPFSIDMSKFVTIALWESIVSRSPHLTGKSYLDMSFQKSMTWRKSSCWDGVLEWIGMVESSCEIVDRDAIETFVTNNVDVEMWTSTTGHVASWMTLRSVDRFHKRSIVVDLSRYSTANRGHVTAVAEATGLWDGKVLPFYLKHIPNPDEDQSAEVSNEGVLYSYKRMKVVFSFSPLLSKIGILTGNLLGISYTGGFWSLAVAIQGIFFFRNWPWVDRSDVGEALLDNLLMHSLYDAGIKKQYRKLQKTKYRQIGWTGVEEQERLLLEATSQECCLLCQA